MTLATALLWFSLSCTLEGQRVESGYRECFYRCADRGVSVLIGVRQECPALLKETTP